MRLLDPRDRISIGTGEFANDRYRFVYRAITKHCELARLAGSYKIVLASRVCPTQQFNRLKLPHSLACPVICRPSD